VLQRLLSDGRLPPPGPLVVRSESLASPRAPEPAYAYAAGLGLGFGSGAAPQQGALEHGVPPPPPPPPRPPASLPGPSRPSRGRKQVSALLSHPFPAHTDGRKQVSALLSAEAGLSGYGEAFRRAGFDDLEALLALDAKVQ
jgi:hypothetical protein